MSPDVEVSSDGEEIIQLDEGMLGVITDIHANPYALLRVLEDGRERGVERWLVLGDVVAMGPEPARVLEQLDALDVVAFVSGNTERYVLTGDRPDPTFAEVEADPTQLPRLVEVAASFAWTKGVLHATGDLDTLRAFRTNARVRFPDGTIALAVHASQLADDGPGITPDVDVTEMARIFPAVAAGVVFGGHTHRQTDRMIDGVRYVNPGSVSNHHTPDRAACYSTVFLEPTRHTIEHHDVEYNKQRAVDAIVASGIPGTDFLIRRFFSG